MDCLVLGFALHACKVAGILRELLSLFKGCDLYTDHEKHCRHGNIPSGVRRSLLIRFFFPQRKSSSLLNSPEHISSLEDYYCIHLIHNGKFIDQNQDRLLVFVVFKKFNSIMKISILSMSAKKKKNWSWYVSIFGYEVTADRTPEVWVLIPRVGHEPLAFSCMSISTHFSKCDPKLWSL